MLSLGAFLLVAASAAGHSSVVPVAVRPAGRVPAQESGATGDQDAAEQEAKLRAALDAEPRSVAANVALGRFLCVQGQTAEGLALLWRATEIDPKDVPAVAALAQSLLEEADWNESSGDSAESNTNVQRARDAIERVKGMAGTEEPSFRALRVRVLIRAGFGEEAFPAALELVKAHPEDLDLHALLVDAANAGAGFDAALAWYDEAKLEPWVVSWFGAAQLAARATWNFNHFVDNDKAMADYAAAADRMATAARLRPDWFAAANERISYYRSWSGWIRHREERYDEAFDLFMSAWGREPSNENAISGLFWVCGRWYETGAMEKAREGYRQLCVVAPERAEFWNNYALICRDTGQYEESFRAYTKAVGLSPDDPRLINDRALILQYHLHRDLDLAEQWLVQAEDLSRAKLAQAESDGDEAAADEQRAILGDALVNLARLFADEGRAVESAEHWNELREVAPARPELPENGGH